MLTFLYTASLKMIEVVIIIIVGFISFVDNIQYIIYYISVFYKRRLPYKNIFVPSRKLVLIWSRSNKMHRVSLNSVVFNLSVLRVLL